MPNPVYPVTRYAPHLWISPARSRMNALVPPRIEAFFNIMKLWHVRDKDAMHLPGGISKNRFYDLKRNRTHLLDPDKLLRVSYIIGIFKALNVLYGRKLADEWVSLRNSNRIFRRMSPLKYMVRGGISAMQTVRRLVDARTTGA